MTPNPDALSGAWNFRDIAEEAGIRPGRFFRSSELSGLDDIDVSEREVLEMESRLSGRDVGFDAPADQDDNDHAPPAPIHYLVDHNDDPALSYERESHEDNQLELLREGMADLDPRSRDILKRRFLGEPKATLQELADEYGVSAERVRQIEANALKKMRALFAA